VRAGRRLPRFLRRGFELVSRCKLEEEEEEEWFEKKRGFNERLQQQTNEPKKTVYLFFPRN
jgi:hypothetical protein